ncbi:unnamed protein product [Symbiodinium sp. CCMP2456]|nr:unnamed protein product [Symbiodinium sp. CCMP2456]
MGKKQPRAPPEPLDDALICKADELTPGTDVVVVGGAHRRIHGYRAVILKSKAPSTTTFNIRVLQGTAEERRKIWTIDQAHVRYGPQGQAQDDGLHASLRWRMTPPPLTVFSARWLLGWQSFSTLVPPKPIKKGDSNEDQEHGESPTGSSLRRPTPKHRQSSRPSSTAAPPASAPLDDEEWVEIEVEAEEPLGTATASSMTRSPLQNSALQGR